MEAIPTGPEFWVGLIALALLIAGPFFAIVVARQPRDLLQPLSVFLAYYFFAYVVKPLLILQDPQHFILGGVLRDPSALTRAVLGAVLGLVCFYIGFFWHRPARRVARWLLPRWHDRLHLTRALAVIIVSGFIAVLVPAALAMREGGARSFLAHIFYQRAEFYFGRGWVAWAGFSLWLFLIMWLSYLDQSGARIYRQFRFVAVFLLILTVMQAYGARTGIVGVGITFVAFYNYRWRRLGVGHLAVLSCILLALVVGSFYIRQAEEFSGVGMMDGILMALARVFDQPDNFAVILERIPDTRDYFWGMLHVEQLVYPLYPRFLFPDKPIVWGTVRIDEMVLGEYAFTTFNPSLLGPLYADFGWGGVAGGMVLLGLFFRSIHRNLGIGGYPGLAMHCFLLNNLYSVMGLGIAHLFAALPYWAALYLTFSYVGLGYRRVPARPGTSVLGSEHPA